MDGKGTIPYPAFPRCDLSWKDKGVIPSSARENLEADLREPGDGGGKGERRTHSLVRIREKGKPNLKGVFLKEGCPQKQVFLPANTSLVEFMANAHPTQRKHLQQDGEEADVHRALHWLVNSPFRSPQAAMEMAQRSLPGTRSVFGVRDVYLGPEELPMPWAYRKSAVKLGVHPEPQAGMTEAFSPFLTHWRQKKN